MKVYVLGGDGFCGWPTALNLSNDGYDVTIVDNLSRRSIDSELKSSSLTPIETIQNRIKIWKRISGNKIAFHNISIDKEYRKICNLLKKDKPDIIIHFAEQRAAPYSMKSSAHKIYTINNNISATHNMLVAIASNSPKSKLIHLGTMGVYGYDSTEGFVIPEGYIKAKLINNNKTIEKKIIYPPDPGSIYHMTKVIDSNMFAFYYKNDDLKITDLHQGIVWGTETELTAIDPGLINRYDYDSDYGTVLNRFIVQSVLDHPLTVYGTGNQTRAFININDTVNCIKLAIQDSKKYDGVKIYNQATSFHKVIDIARMVSKASGVSINYVQNPRKEKKSNKLVFENNFFIDNGLKPILLNQKNIDQMIEFTFNFKKYIKKRVIMPSSFW